MIFLIVLIGMPFVLSYTIAVYWTFRGGVEIGEHSYWSVSSAMRRW
jgi:cytochrome d ubiquinol oxidase subunit II